MHRLGFALASLAFCSAGLAGEWQIDSSHSATQFSVRHLMVSTVRGHFGKTTGAVVYDPANPAASAILAEVDVSTVDTRVEKRDAHLRGPDFFDVEKYPTMTFKSTKAEPAGEGALKMTGDLTIRGVTRPVVLHVEGITPPIKDRAGLRMGATATAKIKRSEFGMTWNRVLETGGVSVGDDVAITIDVELIQRAASSD
ncbi:MAG: polyisoprenoid-binding protein [Bryobacteraceae bacterium]|nr:polyisoprenoid-binding protein [Bryobacteraceae bacterium]